MDDLSACVMEWELNQNSNIMRLADIKNVEKDVDLHFSYPTVWLRHLSEKLNKIVSISFRDGMVCRGHNFIQWLNLFCMVH